jgi:hypothetical protein
LSLQHVTLRNLYTWMRKDVVKASMFPSKAWTVMPNVSNNAYRHCRSPLSPADTP